MRRPSKRGEETNYAEKMTSRGALGRQPV